jgi:hypothetical protein
VRENPEDVNFKLKYNKMLYMAGASGMRRAVGPFCSINVTNTPIVRGKARLPFRRYTKHT